VRGSHADELAGLALPDVAARMIADLRAIQPNLPSDHLSMLRPAHSADLAAILAEFLDAPAERQVSGQRDQAVA